VPLPGSPVPQSGQTLAVLFVGLGLGPRDGAAALLAYLLLGAVGVPVFADGASGWGHLVGPTSGYLVAFVATAGMVGWFAQRGHVRRFAPALVVMLAGHALILGSGWTRLGAAIGYGAAYGQGVAPFILGGATKSVVAAVVAVLVSRYRRFPAIPLSGPPPTRERSSPARGETPGAHPPA
jgi:biotin transport system substrate-specific component